MRGWLLAFTAVAASAALVASASAACMKSEEGQVAQGRLSIGKFKDANDRPETAFILRLPAPACLDGTGDDDKVDCTSAIHVYSADDAVRKKMRRLAGKSVLVRGKPFAQHTAHHHAPIVMDVVEIDAR